MDRKEVIEFSVACDPTKLDAPSNYGYRRATLVAGPFNTVEELRQAWALLLAEPAGHA